MNKGELPDPFVLPGGRQDCDTGGVAGLCARLEGHDRRDGIRRHAARSTDGVEAETLCHSSARGLPGGPNLWSYRVHCHGGERPLSFNVRILFPREGGPFPAIVDGDGCWWYVSDEVAGRVVESGFALVMFNRTEMAEDLGYRGVPDKTRRSGGLYDLYPGREFGALAAWAWGYHRCVDLLQGLPFIDRGPHRRHRTLAGREGRPGGGSRPTTGSPSVNDNASCAAGSPPFRYVGDGGETLDIINAFPSWFGPGLRPFPGREEDIPFDQHCLLAAVAPRPLLLTFALDDRWSNPEGMVQSAWAAGEVYGFLGARDDIAFHLREGGHAHALEDWESPARLHRLEVEGPGTPGGLQPPSLPAPAAGDSHGRPPVTEITGVDPGARHGAAPGALPCRPGFLSTKLTRTNRKPGGFSQ